MNSVYQKFKELSIDRGLIGLTQGDMSESYFCYPVNSHPIGYENYIMYCFIEGYGDMVFASNPMPCCEENVYPLAYNFHDFLCLIISCGSTNPIEQIIGLSRERFQAHVTQELYKQSVEQRKLIKYIRDFFHIEPMDSPYEYVRELQKNFDNSKIIYSDEYYATMGLAPSHNQASTYEFHYEIDRNDNKKV